MTILNKVSVTLLSFLRMITAHKYHHQNYHQINQKILQFSDIRHKPSSYCQLSSVAALHLIVNFNFRCAPSCLSILNFRCSYSYLIESSPMSASSPTIKPLPHQYSQWHSLAFARSECYLKICWLKYSL